MQCTPNRIKRLDLYQEAGFIYLHFVYATMVVKEEMSSLRREELGLKHVENTRQRKEGK